MISDAKNYEISVLFNIDKQVVYFVPTYQREYVWKKDQWDKLFDDLIENERGYFLGSIICINPIENPHEIQHIELIDGQQRITTLSILLAAIYKIFNEISDTLMEDIGALIAEKTHLANLKHKLVLKENEAEPRFVPQAQNYNQQDYFCILKEIGILENADDSPYMGNRRIKKVFCILINEYIVISKKVKIKTKSH